MTTLTQGMQVGEFLLSEADGMRSRDQKTVTVAGAAAIASGTVMGKITATGKLIPYVNGASDGSEAAVGIIYNSLPGVNGDYKATIFTRDCEVIGDRLNSGVALDAPGLADLAALGIVVR